MSLSLVERLEAKIMPEPNSGCWLWIGALTGKGYGKILIDGRLRLAHRVSYEFHVGSVPDGKELDHKCRMKCCVNPSHLEPVSHHENVLRGDAGKYLSNRTHCANGHSFAAGNVYSRTDGARGCRACNREKQARHRQRKKLIAMV